MELIGSLLGGALVEGAKQYFKDDTPKENGQASNNNGGKNNHQCQNNNMGNPSQISFHNQTYQTHQNGSVTFKSERIEIKFFPK